MTRSRAIAITFAAILAAMAFIGLKSASAGTKSSPPSAKSAVIVISTEYTREGIAHNEAISILDPDTLKKLEAFFPKYEKSPRSGLAGGWRLGYRVYFNFPKGKTLLVDVSENGGGAFWTMGGGDQQTNGKFKEFVDALREKKE